MTDDITIGRWRNGGYDWQGQMANIRIYNRTLSSAEIDTLYSAGRTASKDIVNSTDLCVFYSLISGAPEPTPTWTQIAQVATDTTAYSDTTVAADTLYNYRVTATNNVGASDYSNVAQVQTPASGDAPTVALTSPSNGASLTAPADIMLSATASDSYGTIASVGN